MARVERHENRVVSETTVHRTVSILNRVDCRHTKKVFLNILEANYLVSRGKEVFVEDITFPDGTIKSTYFVWINFSCIEENLPTVKGE